VPLFETNNIFHIIWLKRWLPREWKYIILQLNTNGKYGYNSVIDGREEGRASYTCM
jgi:hypothetical protein